MDLQLRNKVIIVTGGAKGIGEGIVKVLANEGAIPVIVGRKAEDNLKVVDELASHGFESFQVVAELTNPDDCEKAVEAVIAKFGRIEGLDKQCRRK
jgi:L-fucose dehydrogenase